MKKASKIWKIEKYGHEFKSGYPFETCCVLPFIVNRQFIYNTELDCLLDIVTGPECNGLKVYKHQVVEKVEIDWDSCIEYAYFKTKKDAWGFESKAYSKEEIEKMDSTSYNLTWPDLGYQKSYTKTAYHWVEAFLQ